MEKQETNNFLHLIEEIDAMGAEKAKMLECIHNLMGVFDTPIARRKVSGEIAEEAREMGREILSKYLKEKEEYLKQNP